MIEAIQQRINKILLEVCKRSYPDMQFRLVNGSLVVELEDPIVSLVDSGINEQHVSSHYRRNKKGGTTLVRGHSRSKSMPSAMELAVAQEKQEENPLAGIDIEKILKEVVMRISKPNSLGIMRA